MKKLICILISVLICLASFVKADEVANPETSVEIIQQDEVETKENIEEIPEETPDFNTAENEEDQIIEKDSVVEEKEEKFLDGDEKESKDEAEEEEKKEEKSLAKGASPLNNLTATSMPSDYVELPWIKSSSAQYIITDYVPSSSDTFVVECLVSSLNAMTVCAFGASDSNDVGLKFFVWNRDREFAYQRGYALTYGSSIFNQRITITAAPNTATWTNGSSTYSTTADSSFSVSSPLVLFATSVGGDYNYFAQMTLYRLTISRGGNVVHNYIPAGRLSDGKTGVYDTVSERFYGSATSNHVCPYNINFVTNSSSSITPLNTFVIPSAMPVPSKDGKVFAGWYYDSELTNPVRAGDVVSEDITVYAKWGDSYYFEIPASITIGGQSFNYQVVSGFKLDVAITSQNGYKLKNSSNQLDYSLSATSFSNLRGNGSVTLTPQLTDPIPDYTGEFTDVLSFSVNISETYTQLQYIQGDQNAFINTGFKPNQNTRVYVELSKMLNSGHHQALFGARTAMGTSDYFLFWVYQNSSTGFRSDYYTENGGTNYSSFNNSSWYTINKNKNVTQINGTSVLTAPTGSFQCPYDLYIFSLNTGGNAQFTSDAKIRKFELYDNGTKIMNLVPMQRDYDGTVGMYDTLNNKFYTNSGSGSFIAGPNA